VTPKFKPHTTKEDHGRHSINEFRAHVKLWSLFSVWTVAMLWTPVQNHFSKTEKQCVFGFVLPVKIRWIYRNSLFSFHLQHSSRSFFWDMSCELGGSDKHFTYVVWSCGRKGLRVSPQLVGHTQAPFREPWYSIRIPSWNWGLTWWLTWFNHKTTMRLWSLTRFKHCKGTIYIYVYIYMYMYIANILIKHTQSGTQKEDIYGYLWIFKYI